MFTNATGSKGVRTLLKASLLSGSIFAVIAGTGLLAVVSQGSRVKADSVTVPGPTATLTLNPGWTLVTWPGPGGIPVGDALRGSGAAIGDTDVSKSVSVIYGWNPSAEDWLGFFPAAAAIPGANDLTSLGAGAVYWVYCDAQTPVTWTVTGSAPATQGATPPAPPTGSDGLPVTIAGGAPLIAYLKAQSGLLDVVSHPSNQLLVVGTVVSSTGNSFVLQRSTGTANSNPAQLFDDPTGAFANSDFTVAVTGQTKFGGVTAPIPPGQVVMVGGTFDGSTLSADLVTDASGPTQAQRAETVPGLLESPSPHEQPARALAVSSQVGSGVRLLEATLECPASISTLPSTSPTPLPSRILAFPFSSQASNCSGVPPT